MIDDERLIAKSLGIRLNLAPIRISYFEKSDRVSVRWQARVQGRKSKIRSALIIQPNFDTKEKALAEWSSKQNVGIVHRIKNELESEGFSIDE